MTKDEKLAQAKELKNSSGGVLWGYVLGLVMVFFFIVGDLTVFGIFAAIFLGMFAFLAIFWYARVSGLEVEDE